MQKENKLLEELKDLIDEYGMELLLGAIISIVSHMGDKQQYLKNLKSDLKKTLKNYKNRYDI
jgi:predicted house-cleaning noncanonical NTP pyrophosphatase (MazG superfamily)